MRVVVVMSVAVACAHPAPAPTAPAGPDDEAQVAEANVAWSEGKVAAICACADRSCASELNREIGDWMPAHFGEARLDEAQRQRLRDAGLRTQACLAAESEISKAAQAIIDMRAIETRMCACADAACVERTAEELIATAKKYENTKASEAETAEADAIMARVTACGASASTP
jgi:hypothetical protein